jgi:hypothetical protein
MKINVAIAGAIITGGTLPEKLTRLVRALLTSAKNEVDGAATEKAIESKE